MRRAVIIAIGLGLVIAAVFGWMSTARVRTVMKEKSELVKLSHLGRALVEFSNKNDDRYPRSLDELKPYLKERKAFTSPFAEGADGASFELVAPGAELEKFEKPEAVVAV